MRFNIRNKSSAPSALLKYSDARQPITLLTSAFITNSLYLGHLQDICFLRSWIIVRNHPASASSNTIRRIVTTDNKSQHCFRRFP